MDKKSFILAVISLQIFFLAIDVWHVYRSRQRLGMSDFFRLPSWIFLLAVFVVYGGIQAAGMTLMPKDVALIQQADRIVDSFWGDGPHRTMTAGWIAFFALAGFYSAGFWDYLIHRFFSHSRWFWFSHEYHHLPNRIFLLLPGFSVRPFAVFALFPATAGGVLTIAGLFRLTGHDPSGLLPVFYLVSLAQVLVGLFTHSGYCVEQNWMHRVLSPMLITSPQEHRLHHTVDLNGNFGNFTMLWDRVFGSYLDPAAVKNQGHRLGLAYDQDPLGAITLGRIKLSKNIRRNFYVSAFCNIQ